MAKRIDRYIQDYVVFDLETTGTSVNRDMIIEISALRVRNGEVADEFSCLVDPGCPIPYYATQVNNITDEMVEGAPKIEEILPDFISFVGDDILLGQNIQRFDLKFIYRDCKKNGLHVPDNDYVDTLPISKVCLPQLSHHTLSDLAGYFGISTKGAHRALADCYMTHRIYTAMGSMISEAYANIPICSKCGQTMVRRKGKYGEFWGCSGYPGCTFTKNINVIKTTIKLR